MLTNDQVREYVKDIDILNKLPDGHLQSWDSLIDLARQLTIGDFNRMPPVTTYTADNAPDGTDAIILYGILHHLANAEAERQLRNNVTYSAQGLNVGIDDKFAMYNQLAQYYKGLFGSEAASYKQYLNEMEAWGGSHSPYLNINAYQYRD